MPDASRPSVSEGSAATEHRFHDYVGNDIPWYVRA